jgi:hypothetical protein
MNDRVERVGRAIYQAQNGTRSDEDWAEIWAFHTDPYVTARGGPSEIVRTARAAIEAADAGKAEAADLRYYLWNDGQDPETGKKRYVAFRHRHPVDESGESLVRGEPCGVVYLRGSQPADR